MRRANGTGSICHLGGKRHKPYYARVTVQIIEGDQIISKLKGIGTFRTKREAQQALDEYNQQGIIANNITVKEACNILMQEIAGAKKSKYYAYKGSIEKLKPIFNVELQKLKLYHCEMIFRQYNGASKSTINNIRIVFNWLFEFGVKNDICSKNYVKYVNVNCKELTGTTALTKSKVLELMRMNTKESRLLLLYIFTGRRCTELMELNKGNINITKQCYTITKAKTKSSLGVFPIADYIKPIFKEFMQKSSSSTLLDYKYYDICDICKELTGTTTHALRKTFTTLAIESGIPKVIIDKLIGHTTGDLTTDVYTTLHNDTALKEVNKIYSYLMQERESDRLIKYES